VHLARLIALVAAVLIATGCGAIKRTAIKTVARTLSESGTTFTSHNDPDTIEAALPFALTLYESLLATIPNDVPLLTATCSANTQYAYGFVQVDAEVLQFDDFDKSKELSNRALRLALRARDFCWRGLEVRFKGIGPKLRTQAAAAALSSAGPADVPLLYWSAASLGAAISLGGLGRPDLIVDWPMVRTLAERALALDEAWNNGAIHELLMTIESQGALLGGSEPRAREHFARAVAIQKGRAAGPYLGLALGVAKGKQDRAEFEKLLKQALAVNPNDDPDNRLVTLIMQKRARFYLDHLGDLFP
jgi:tetratricopeptide (TPR) repeat protein